MTKLKVGHVVASTLGALVVGVICGCLIMRAVADQELRGLALAQELEVSGLCANGLKLHSTQRGDSLVALLEERLDSSVSHVAELVDEGARLYPGTQSLIDSLRRAGDYYASKQNAEKKQSTEALLARLRSQQ